MIIGKSICFLKHVNGYENHERKVLIMGKIETLLEAAKLNELIGKKEEKKKTNVIIWVLAIVGAVVAIAAIAYAVYRYFSPNYMDDFEDDFEDELDDEFEDEEDIYSESTEE